MFWHCYLPTFLSACLFKVLAKTTVIGFGFLHLNLFFPKAHHGAHMVDIVTNIIWSWCFIARLTSFDIISSVIEPTIPIEANNFIKHDKVIIPTSEKTDRRKTFLKISSTQLKGLPQDYSLHVIGLLTLYSSFPTYDTKHIGQILYRL